MHDAASSSSLQVISPSQSKQVSPQDFIHISAFKYLEQLPEIQDLSIFWQDSVQLSELGSGVVVKVVKVVGVTGVIRGVVVDATVAGDVVVVVLVVVWGWG